jgi:hypothetical protein
MTYRVRNLIENFFTQGRVTKYAKQIEDYLDEITDPFSSDIDETLQPIFYNEFEKYINKNVIKKELEIIDNYNIASLNKNINPLQLIALDKKARLAKKKILLIKLGIYGELILLTSYFDKEFNKVLNDIFDDYFENKDKGSVLIKYKETDDITGETKDVYYTINLPIITRLVDYYTGVNVDKFVQQTASDQDFILATTFKGYLPEDFNFELEFNESQAGAYFPYQTTKYYGLEKYQITHKGISLSEYKKITDRNCLLSSIETYAKEFDIESKELIHELENIMIENFRAKDVSKILKLCFKDKDFCIRIKKYHLVNNKIVAKSTHNNRDIIYGNKDSENIIKLVQYANHFMPDIKYNPKSRYANRHESKPINIINTLNKIMEFNQLIDSEHSIIRNNTYRDDQLELSVKLDQRIHTYKPKDILVNDKLIYLADCESSIDSNGIHRAFLIGYSSLLNDDFKMISASSYEEMNNGDIFIKMLDDLISRNPIKKKIRKKDKDVEDNEDEPDGDIDNRDLTPSQKTRIKNTIVIYFHNAKYDMSLIKNNDRMIITSECSKSSQFYSYKILYKSRRFEIRDSYKLINKPLKDFKTMFTLSEGKKEFNIYDFFTPEKAVIFNLGYLDEEIEEYFLNKYGDEIGSKKYKKFISSNDQYFKNRTNRHKGLSELYSDYLKADVKTLKTGLIKFREIMKNITELDILNYLTISSIGLDYVKSKGCLDGIVEVTGALKLYLDKHITGGRVCIENNKPTHRTGKIADCDAVGLYASSMYIMKLVKGFYHYINQSDSANYLSELYEKYAWFCITIEGYTTINLPIPFVSYMENDKRVWSNDIVGKKIYTNSVELETQIKYNGLVITNVIQGVGIKHGEFNLGINGIMRHLTDSRNKAKKDKNTGLSESLKLVGNSIYGKSLTKDVAQEIRHMSEAEFQKLIRNDPTLLISAKQRCEYKAIKGVGKNKIVNKTKYYRVKLKLRFIKSYKLSTFGIMCLAYSKDIMNRVMGEANVAGIPIFYQDTDSMHMFYDDIPKLSSQYEKIYNKKLIGSDMCQFHNDFNPPQDPKERKKIGWVMSPDEVYSTEFIAIAKKFYIDRTQNDYVDEKGNKPNKAYHIRCKGISTESIIDYCETLGTTPLELYKMCLNDDYQLEVAFSKRKAMFKYSDSGVRTTTDGSKIIKRRCIKVDHKK